MSLLTTAVVRLRALYLTSLFPLRYLHCFNLLFSNDVNVTDQDGNTALHLAAISSKTDCMRVLLRAGATDSLGLGMYTITTICPL